MKTEFTIKLNTIKDINNFVGEMLTFESDIDALRGRYVLNAKSLIGLFTLDLTMPLDIKINAINEEELIRFNEVIVKYLD